MIDMLAMGQQILASQPFSVFLGAQLTAFNDEQVELHLPLRDELKQQNGFAHGGVLSYLADNALTFAGGARLGPAVLTAEYKINMLNPAHGEKLVARARVIKHGKTLVITQCDVFAVKDGRESLCATMLQTLMVMRGVADSRRA